MGSPSSRNHSIMMGDDHDHARINTTAHIVRAAKNASQIRGTCQSAQRYAHRFLRGVARWAIQFGVSRRPPSKRNARYPIKYACDRREYREPYSLSESRQDRALCACIFRTSTCAMLWLVIYAGQHHVTFIGLQPTHTRASRTQRLFFC